MGLVKFGQQTLNIDNIPDGSIIVSEQEYNQLRSQSNGYLLLKSKIPVGVDETQIPALLEKGSRYDQKDKEFVELSKAKADIEARLQAFNNMPKDFSIDKWNQYVKKEQDEVFSRQIDDLTKKVYERVEKETGVKYVVDFRFIPADVLKTFDPSAKDAEEKWYKILDDAHTEQLKFIESSLNQSIPLPAQVGKAGAGDGSTEPPQRRLADIVADDKVRVGRL